MRIPMLSILLGCSCMPCGVFADPPRSVFLSALATLETTPNERLLATLSSFITAHLQAIAQDQTLDPASQDTQRRSLLIGLAALFDTSEILLTQRFTRSHFHGVVTPEETSRRRHLTDRFSVHGRQDAMQHFFVSSGLAVIVGPLMAERVGRIKEFADARHRDAHPDLPSQGFSFVDLAYDLAGIHFAVSVLSDRSAPTDAGWLERFVVGIPALGLPENLGWREFKSTYGGEHWSRFESLLEQIRHATSGDPE